jgi:hypothetical protein
MALRLRGSHPTSTAKEQRQDGQNRENFHNPHTRLMNIFTRFILINMLELTTKVL